MVGGEPEDKQHSNKFLWQGFPRDNILGVDILTSVSPHIPLSHLKPEDYYLNIVAVQGHLKQSGYDI